MPEIRLAMRPGGRAAGLPPSRQVADELDRATLTWRIKGRTAGMSPSQLGEHRAVSQPGVEGSGVIRRLWRHRIPPPAALSGGRQRGSAPFPPSSRSHCRAAARVSP